MLLFRIKQVYLRIWMVFRNREPSPKRKSPDRHLNTPHRFPPTNKLSLTETTAVLGRHPHPAPSGRPKPPLPRLTARRNHHLNFDWLPDFPDGRGGDRIDAASALWSWDVAGDAAPGHSHLGGRKAGAGYAPGGTPPRTGRMGREEGGRGDGGGR